MNVISTILGIGSLFLLSLWALLRVLATQLTWELQVLLVGAGVFAVLWLIVERISVMRFFQSKATKHGANALLTVFLVFGILAFLNVLGVQHKIRKDFTRVGANTLSEQTQKVLQSLDRPVRLVYFGSMREKEKAEALLRNYALESKNFQWEVLDPNREPTRAEALGFRKKLDSAVLMRDGSEKKTYLDGSTEEKITNGLIRFLKEGEQTVCYLQGHGEREFQPVAETAETFGILGKEIEKESYKLKLINIYTEGKIASDCAVLLVVGPKTAFFPKELDEIKAWSKNGGRLLLSLQIDIRAEGLSKGSQQLADLLKDVGINVSKKILVDPLSKAAGKGPEVLLGFRASSEHPITRDFPSSRQGIVANFYFPIATHIETKPMDSWTLTPLAFSSPQAWAEEDWKSIKSGVVAYNEGQDRKGPLTLALAAEEKSPEEAEKKDAANQKKTARLVVFSGTDFASSGFVASVGNRDLFLNSIGWLASQESFLSIRAKGDEALELLDPNPALLTMSFWVSVVFVPLFVAILGWIVWLRRRRQ